MSNAVSTPLSVAAIVGPTGAGKTALACEAAGRLGCEIICADSMQIYRGIEIASATPSEEERQLAPHRLFGIRDTSESFSVASYIELADREIRAVTRSGRLPMLVGGTGLYIDSLLKGIQFPPEDGKSAAVRAELEAEAEELGCAELLRRLAKLDPETATRLHENDRKRIIRALELIAVHGKTPTELNRQSRERPSPYKSALVGVTYRDRARLYERIELRVEKMLSQGLLEEARRARSELGSTAVQAIGHKELYPYLDGEISLDEAVERLKRATRRYAKRQLTWFGRDPRIHWIYADCCDDPVTEATEHIKTELAL